MGWRLPAGDGGHGLQHALDHVIRLVQMDLMAAARGGDMRRV